MTSGPPREKSPPRLILASASPRRHQLLDRLGLPHLVAPTRVEEWEHRAADPTALVTHNADIKSAAAAARHPDVPVLAADTTVALNGEVLNKPADLAEARQMLRRLAGHTHRVLTGLRLRWPARAIDWAHVETSEVTFLPPDESRLERYLALVDTLDKAGAYGIQEGRELIVAGWRGSFTNIMGLPVEVVRDWAIRLELDPQPVIAAEEGWL